MIYYVGECLIDMIAEEVKPSLKEVDGFLKRAGGALANMAVATSKLGATAYFVGQVGKDSFGDFLIAELKSYGVRTEYCFQTKEAKTALAFVSLDEQGERDFEFYRKNSADLLLSIDQVSSISFTKEDLLVFGSVGLVESDLKRSTEYLLKKAKQAGATILFDPNIRLNLWDNEENCIETIRNYLFYVDYLKIADNELELICSEKNWREYFFDKGIQSIFLTRGELGSSFISKEEEIHVPAYVVNAIDTTGAGDSFVGALATKLQEKSLEEWDKKELLSFCNLCAAITTTRKGAQKACPNLQVLKNYLH